MIYDLKFEIKLLRDELGEDKTKITNQSNNTEVVPDREVKKY